MVYLHKKSHPYNCLVPVHKLTGTGDTTATSTGPSGDGTNPSKIKKGGLLYNITYTCKRQP